jgi:hypothetical protein
MVKVIAYYAEFETHCLVGEEAARRYENVESTHHDQLKDVECIVTID